MVARLAEANRSAQWRPCMCKLRKTLCNAQRFGQFCTTAAGDTVCRRPCHGQTCKSARRPKGRRARGLRLAIARFSCQLCAFCRSRCLRSCCRSRAAGRATGQAACRRLFCRRRPAHSVHHRCHPENRQSGPRCARRFSGQRAVRFIRRRFRQCGQFRLRLGFGRLAGVFRRR